MPLSGWLAVVDGVVAIGLLWAVPRQRENKASVHLVVAPKEQARPSRQFRHLPAASGVRCFTVRAGCMARRTPRGTNIRLRNPIGSPSRRAGRDVNGRVELHH
jgi:hypothetical protein